MYINVIYKNDDDDSKYSKLMKKFSVTEKLCAPCLRKYALMSLSGPIDLPRDLSSLVTNRNAHILNCINNNDTVFRLEDDSNRFLVFKNPLETAELKSEFAEGQIYSANNTDLIKTPLQATATERKILEYNDLLPNCKTDEICNDFHNHNNKDIGKILNTGDVITIATRTFVNCLDQSIYGALNGSRLIKHCNTYSLDQSI